MSVINDINEMAEILESIRVTLRKRLFTAHNIRRPPR